MNYYIIPSKVKVSLGSKHCQEMDHTICGQVRCGQCIFSGRHRAILKHLATAGLLTERVLYE